MSEERDSQHTTETGPRGNPQASGAPTSNDVVDGPLAPPLGDSTKAKSTADRSNDGGLWLSNLFAWGAALLCALATWQLQETWVVGTCLVAIAIAILISQSMARRAVRRAFAAATPASRRDEEMIRSELEVVANQLERRERKLAERLAVFHQWLEFPEPIQLADSSSADSSNRSTTKDYDVDEAREFYKKDQLLLQLIEEETESLFNRILANTYMVKGHLDTEAARADALELVRRVAHIYQPDVEEPLLETSVALILRSASRAALQLLVVLEQLPLDIKELSVNKLYGYVRTAVQAYGVYKAARPYFPWVTNALYVGRYAFGANPISLGAWYATGTLGQRLAKATTDRVINQHALQLIQNLVQLTAFEVAQAYSGDFRRRDPNWIYAAELTNLVSQLPASARSLSLAMTEVGSLQLRSEYDRVWFYRCLAAGQPSGANQQTLGLSARDRLGIANRLERFIESLPTGLGDAVSQWRVEAERSLNIKLGAVTYEGGESAVQHALRSLGGFLLEIKNLPDDQWMDPLSKTATASLAPRLMDAMKDDPPFLLEYPKLSPGSEVAQAFVADLMKLGASLPGRGPDVTASIEELTAYLRMDPETVRNLWHESLLTELKLALGEERWRGTPPEGACAIGLDILDQMENRGCLFWPAKLLTVEADDDETAGPLGSIGNVDMADDPTPLMVIVGDGQVAAWQAGDIVPLWEASTSDVTAERHRGVLGSYCHLHANDLPTLVLEGAAWTRYQRYFAPLLQSLGQDPT